MSYNFSEDTKKENKDNPDFVAVFGQPEDGRLSAVSELEISAFNILSQLDPIPVREHRFHSVRKWRFDFAYPDFMIAVEIEGGTRNNGRHNRHEGFTADCEKYNTAVVMGWRVLRFTSEMVSHGQLKATVEKALRRDYE